MASPEAKQDLEELRKRTGEKISDIALNVAFRHQLPQRCFVIVQDESTGINVGCNIGLVQLSESSIRVDLLYGGPLKDNDIFETVDDIIQDPSIPLICDQKVAEELSQHSLTWIDEGHYRLEGRPGGVLEVYTPYSSVPLPEVNSPELGISGQLYTE